MKKVSTLFWGHLLVLLGTLGAVGSLVPFKDFPYRPLVYSFHTPDFLTVFAHFDGAHYINIAAQGYHQFDQTFFPAFPFLLRLISPIFLGNYLVAGFILANIASLIGFVLLLKILAKMYSKQIALWTCLFMLAFPSAFFFHAVYTEGFFLLFVTLTWWMYLHKKTFGSAFFAGATALTRIIGVTALLLFFPHVASNWRKNIKQFAGVVVGSFLGLGAYCFYLWRTTGDPFMFISAQPSFNSGRSSSIVLLPQVYYRYAKILLTAAHDYAYWIAVAEVVTISIVGLVLLHFLYRAYEMKNMDELGIGLFSLVGLLIPASTGTFLSMSRFSLFCFGFFIYLAKISSVRIRIGIMGIFGVLQIPFFVLFARGYFVA